MVRYTRDVLEARSRHIMWEERGFQLKDTVGDGEDFRSPMNGDRVLGFE